MAIPAPAAAVIKATPGSSVNSPSSPQVTKP